MAAMAAGSVQQKAQAAQHDVDAFIHDVSNAKVFGDANKWGTFFQRVEWVVNTVFEAVGAAIGGVAAAVLWLALKSYEIITYLLIGFILILLGALVIDVVTALAPAATTVSEIIDAILKFLKTGVNAAISGLLYFVNFINHDIIDNINKIPGVHIHEISLPLKKWSGFNLIDVSAVHAWCVSLAPTCMKFNGAFKILLYLIRVGGHDQVCDLVRYMYPLEER